MNFTSLVSNNFEMPKIRNLSFTRCLGILFGLVTPNVQQLTIWIGPYENFKILGEMGTDWLVVFSPVINCRQRSLIV